MKRTLISTAALLAALASLLYAVGFAITAAAPPYRDAAGYDNYTEKMTGLYLLKQSAKRDDNLIIYGSSELRTMEVSTHPSNFFAGKRSGIQVNIIGRGSCQSLTHAMSIAASGDALRGKKVVLIASPQSFVPEGIAPDLFMANFSRQQYLEIMADADITPELKSSISSRVLELFGQYEAMPESAGIAPDLRRLAEHGAGPTALTTVRNAALTPYYAFSRFLYDLKDKVTAREVILSVQSGVTAAINSPIDWEAEERDAIAEAEIMTDNNDFGILNDYYTTYIGTRLSRQKDMDANLDYSVSREYGDLRILFEICRQKGIDPLFIHVPLHGRWSDYTGFTENRRKAYYDHVNRIANEYGIQTLDLTGYEYEDYFLCDIMHLGWKGWLFVDRALIEYFYSS
ncbi:MAG: D-alanyl-lipoteichoic acid biosynthesis protein DltD [Oscillospiraceae bacterium]|nr:D-alanyl-lipoteichoic acid biosynthesis protein DltD [Oscillospiraceae bacterium]